MSKYALGIALTPDTLHAVLLERTEEGTEVRFTRRIPRSTEPGLPGESGVGPPEMEEEPQTGPEGDVEIQFGDETGGDDMFLDSEFGGLDSGEISEAGPSSASIQAQFDTLLDECEERGYEDPEIAFCASGAEIDEIELRIPTDEENTQSEDSDWRSLPASRETLIEVLEQQYEGEVEDERVAFVPMRVTSDGQKRVLAVIARPGGPVLSTLSAMHEQTLSRTPRVQLLDAEVPVYTGLTRWALQLPKGSTEKSILVRVGTDDSHVLFFEGNTLRQTAYLPELTIEDPDETICSRVLLLQDEHGISEPQHLLLAAEKDEETLAGELKVYFSNAQLHLLRDSLPVDGAEESEVSVAATAMALRLLGNPGIQKAFHSVDLLPSRYQPSMFRLTVGWSVPALLGLLAITTLAFVWVYVTNANRIADRQVELRSLERQIEEVDKGALQRRVDSLRSSTDEYREAHAVVDRLLEGSNRWSRGLASVTDRLDEISGLSISEWSPAGEDRVTVTGRTNSRVRTARLARELNGEVNVLTFTEVRDYGLFDFVITIPLNTAKPEAVEYWREQEMERRVGEMSGPERSTPQPPVDATAEASVSKEEKKADENTEPSSSTKIRNAANTSAELAWSVIVGSLLKEARAERVANRFRKRLNQDYPVHVHEMSQDERYRVCVGEFSAEGEAQSLLKNRSDLFPSEAWLRECRVSAEAVSAEAVSAEAMASN